MRDQIKAQVLGALPSEVHEARKTAAQCTAAIAVIELPQKQWGPVIEELCNRITGDHGNNHVKQSSLEALGYICEEIVRHARAAYGVDGVGVIAAGEGSIRSGALKRLPPPLPHTLGSHPPHLATHWFGRDYPSENESFPWPTSWRARRRRAVLHSASIT